ncbi:MAG: hypothetical protein LBC71_00840 [Oscillospiraceae bacterium]|jgi:hypothetical protein|nr:hypothetical protein [Oscillospiraceae bacterium]
MKIRTFFFAIVFTLLIISISSCANIKDNHNDPDPQEFIQDDTSIDDKIIIKDDITDNSVVFAELTHISQILADNVTIDAKVALPISNLSSYRITRNTLTPDDLFKIFNEDINNASITDSEYDQNGFTATTTKGAYMYHEDITLRYSYNQKYAEIADVMCNYAERVTSINGVVFDTFNREEAFEYVASVFEKLGVLGLPSIMV